MRACACVHVCVCVCVCLCTCVHAYVLCPAVQPELEEYYADEQAEKKAVIDQISLCVLRDPVFTSSGHTYSRAILEKNRLVDPISHEQLKPQDLVPNRMKAGEVNDYLDCRLKADIKQISSAGEWRDN